MWIKKGLIYNVDGAQLWAQSHAQMPTSFIRKDGEISILFSTRDKNNKSRISSIVVSSKNPSLILSNRSAIELDLGNPGSFDDAGVMPSSIVKVGSKYFLYYIGWNDRITIPYHNSIGLAVSDDGEIFRRVYEGPIMDRTHQEPYFCSAPTVIFEEGLWKMWYLSCTEWISINGKLEPRYHLKYAESLDGVIWAREGKIAIDYTNSNEGGIVRAAILKESNKAYKMWFSYRGKCDYRDRPSSAYRIGYAESNNGIDWTRDDGNAGISISDSGWDSFMVAYPDIVKCNGSIYMFYNGNGFGKTGIGYATLNQREKNHA